MSYINTLYQTDGPFYAVLGNPITHSQSPKIQQLFAQSVGIKCRYERIRVPLNNFAGTLNSLIAQGLQGCNVTVPFKLTAFTTVNQYTERAQLAHAVNCLIRQADHSWLADNTDGAGLVADLKRLRGTHDANGLNNARILILGAGGAVQGSIAPLLAAGAIIHIANRTVSQAHVIADLFNKAVTAHSLEETLPACDIVINATSASLYGKTIQPNVGALRTQGLKTLAYDMMYAAKPTPFMQWCSFQGADVADGLGMLIEQAAESFYLWHGVRPDTQQVHQNSLIFRT
jgi:shikimate dehydrogenase